MKKLQELINKSKGSVSIDINTHRTYYETIEEFVEPEDRKK